MYWFNDISFTNNYVNIVQKKSFFKTIDTKTIFDEMWYIVELFLVDIFSFLIILHHLIKLKKHR